jgi:UDP-N-acetylmuramate: L-alanyl-gamma-D-glutamyl-meso-diaminopimelate ligase
LPGHGIDCGNDNGNGNDWRFNSRRSEISLYSLAKTPTLVFEGKPIYNGREFPFMQRLVRRIHFLGVCGTAMGSAAAAVRDLGFIVSGSDDNVYPPMSTFLESKGISISRGFRPENIPDNVDLVVIGNAMIRGNPEVEAVLNRKLLYQSLPETLKNFFLQGKTNLVVTGTHGKTTTTSLLTWIFREAGRNPSFLIGGIAKDLGQGALFTDSDYFVLEGDEYDTAFFDKRSKFIHYLPHTLIINNIEFDHADIFSSLEEIKLSFRRLISIVPTEGRIFFNSDDPNCEDVIEKSLAKTCSIGFAKSAAHRITDVRYESDGSRFKLAGEEFRLSLLGEFNVRNAAMAASAALAHGLPLEIIKHALATFGGVSRRQELRGEAGGVKVIDDFGHHPTAIRETLSALRHRFPHERLWAIFEPRSNTTRRAVFQDSLPAALSLADGVILAKVARLDQLPPEDRLNPEEVVESIQQSGIPAFYEPSVDAIVHRVVPLTKPGDVIVVFSNGGFEGIHQKLLTELALR